MAENAVSPRGCRVIWRSGRNRKRKGEKTIFVTLLILEALSPTLNNYYQLFLLTQVI